VYVFKKFTFLITVIVLKKSNKTLKITPYISFFANKLTARVFKFSACRTSFYLFES